MDKKEYELKILNKIYKTPEYIISQTEKPDFILIDTKTSEKFGVEITRLYYDESSARLKEKSNYVNDIFDKKICKEDVGVLKPCQLYIKQNGKYTFLADVVSQPLRKYKDYINAIIKTIKDKTIKAKFYQNTEYLELFIEDKENYLHSKNIEEIKFLYDSEDLYNVVGESPFKRVYIFTNINGKEMLCIIGDIRSSPFYFEENDMDKHDNYMNELFENSDKKIQEDYGQKTYYPRIKNK